MLDVCDLRNAYLSVLLTGIRHEKTDRAQFRKFAELLGDFLLQECVKRNFFSLEFRSVNTPMNAAVDGVFLKPKSIVAVPILRAGNAWTPCVFRILSDSIPVAQLLIQRNEESAKASVLLAKLPPNIENFETVLVLDPMLATGGSIIAAIQVLLERGVTEEQIVLVHAVGCPEGLLAVESRFPKIRGIVGVVDSGLDSRKYIVPGLGDFGDRFYT